MNEGPAKTTLGLAITSLVLGVLSPLCCSVVTGIPAVICGHIARSKIKKDPTLQGEGLAIAGLVLGYISIALTLVGLLTLAPMVGKFRGVIDSSIALEEARVIQGALQRSESYPVEAGVTTVAQFKEHLVKSGQLTAEEVEGVDFSRLLIGNVSNADPSGTILIRAKEAGPYGIVLFVPKDGEVEGLMPEEAKTNEPPREPAYLQE
jgi:Domain of unknown function (DUF4190)